jgi:phosphoenolpyruvate-protein kinase (PTS system EI component)
MGHELEGLAASPGSAAGRVRLLGVADATNGGTVAADRRGDEERRARQALETAGDQIVEIAARLRELGRAEEAEIVETGSLLARDPGLQAAVSASVLERGLPAPAAILETAEAQAAVIAKLDDARLAERADDIRSVGRRAAALLGPEPRGDGDPDGNGSAQILIASDLGPADVAQLESGIAGIALAAGGVSAHAAIVARSLGIPMVVAVGDELLAVGPGDQLVVDGTAGTVVLSPDRGAVEEAMREIAERADRRERSRATRELPAVTPDGHPVRVLANAAGEPEVRAGLDAGAEGVGLLRTELAFLDAKAWPSEEAHRERLAPILGALGGRVATVRVLDFGGDKTPPFLRGTELRGVELLLDHPDALEAQLRAILAVAGGADLRILLPIVESVKQVDLARGALIRALDELPGRPSPSLGAMIETPGGVEAAERIASNVDFLSIGTNDLTHSVLGRDRFSTQVALPHDPRVLRSIAAVVEAGRHAGVPVEVCGEAASSPISAPLLIGAGVDELSVGAARVGAVRAWVRGLRYRELRQFEVIARRLSTSAHVETLLGELPSRLEILERADAGGEAVERQIGVGPARR